MQELGINVPQVLEWFAHETETSYVLVKVTPELANNWASTLGAAIRRCYLADEFLNLRTQELESELAGTPEDRRAKIIGSRLPDPGSTMAGDFGEILGYVYQSAKAYPRIAIGPKKWRLKQDRNKPAPFSDVIHFILPSWPTASEQDEILCAEVKLKSTNGSSSPIRDAIKDCEKDRTSRLSSTLQWLKARALGESLGVIQIAHLDRFINAIDHPPVTKRFRAVAVICSSLLEAEIKECPNLAPADYSLVVISVPNLHAVYNAVYVAASTTT